MRRAFLAILLLPSLAQAQAIESVTFDEAVRRALTNHPTVQQAAIDILRAEAVLQQVRGRSLPSLNASFSANVIAPVTEFAGEALNPRTQTVTSAAFSVPLLTAVNWAQRNQAADQIFVSQRAAEDARRQIAIATGITGPAGSRRAGSWRGS